MQQPKGCTLPCPHYSPSLSLRAAVLKQFTRRPHGRPHRYTAVSQHSEGGVVATRLCPSDGVAYLCCVQQADSGLPSALKTKRQHRVWETLSRCNGFSLSPSESKATTQLTLPCASLQTHTGIWAAWCDFESRIRPLNDFWEQNNITFVIFSCLSLCSLKAFSAELLFINLLLSFSASVPNATLQNIRPARRELESLFSWLWFKQGHLLPHWSRGECCMT